MLLITTHVLLFSSVFQNTIDFYKRIKTNLEFLHYFLKVRNVSNINMLVPLYSPNYDLFKGETVIYYRLSSRTVISQANENVS